MLTLDNTSRANPCDGCPALFVCRCLRLTEEVLAEAVSTLDIKTVKELRQHTGAGEGCTACHAQLCRVLETHADPYCQTP